MPDSRNLDLPGMRSTSPDASATVRAVADRLAARASAWDHRPTARPELPGWNTPATSPPGPAREDPADPPVGHQPPIELARSVLPQPDLAASAPESGSVPPQEIPPRIEEGGGFASPAVGSADDRPAQSPTPVRGSAAATPRIVAGLVGMDSVGIAATPSGDRVPDQRALPEEAAGRADGVPAISPPASPGFATPVTPARRQEGEAMLASDVPADESARRPREDAGRDGGVGSYLVRYGHRLPDGGPRPVPIRRRWDGPRVRLGIRGRRG